MYIYIYKGSITEATDVEVIVNPVNETIGLGGGLAKHVAEKAGSALKDECKRFVTRNGPLEVAQNFQSTAGNLPFKAVIHAVGPQWGNYAGRQEICARHLHDTVVNALMTVRAESWRSVALPAICAGISGMPKQLCAEMYIIGFADFAENGPDGLREVHFVDTSGEMVNLVVAAYERWISNSRSISIQNANNYPPPREASDHSFRENQGAHSQKVVSQNQPSQPKPSQPQQRTKGKFYGFGDESAYMFKVSGLDVKVYKGSITELQGIDAIVSSTVQSLEHRCGVARHIAETAGDDMQQECLDYVRRHGNVKMTNIYISSPGELACLGIVHAVGPQWAWYDGNRSKCAEDLYRTVINALVGVKRRGWSSVAMSAISAEHSGVPKQLCAEMIVKAITAFAERGPGSVKKIHFVDLNSDILNMIVNAHKSWVQDPSTLSFDNANSYG